MVEYTPEVTLPLAGLQHSTAEMTLTVQPPRGIMVIRGDQSVPEFNDWFARHFGTRCPIVGQTIRGRGFTLYWHGPDQLMLCCDDLLGVQDWGMKLTLSRPETPWVSLIEISDYFCTIALQGARGFDVLRQGCPYDFAQLTEGKAILSNFQKANMLVDHATKDHITVMVRASFAQYLWDHLVYASNQLPHFAFHES